ncbi:uncharacterized protein LOC122247579 isoform X2 [Penaeus japonicus]|uniref:uncharacterized protein LOC122247579 isoform X2 n=1 Tax=Penaeus japonicus TaxID=27405 RepID=UPI001C70EFD2|nr:uncharacterized protein LOC122247579 isoform X2 [Penaeus japonicus]
MSVARVCIDLLSGLVRVLRWLFCCCPRDTERDVELADVEAQGQVGISGAEERTEHVAGPSATRSQENERPDVEKGLESVTSIHIDHEEIFQMVLTQLRLNEKRHFDPPIFVIPCQPDSSSRPLRKEYSGHPTLTLHHGARNFNQVIKERNGGMPSLDLHGMTVREAKDWTEFFISHHEDKGTEVVSVITGRGNNSVDGKAKIRPVIERLLCDLGLDYRVVNKGGCLTVWL